MAIPDKSDLNSYKTPGVYASKSGKYTGTHYPPIGGAFGLVVSAPLGSSGSSYILQQVYPWTKNQHMYFRTFDKWAGDNGEWSDWCTIIDSTHTPASIGAAAANHTHSNYLTTTGTAAAATKLATARTINGTSFNGTTNIVTSNWGTARTLTIGNTGKSVNGSGNVSWTLSEIGAAASSHSHSYLPLSGGTLSGMLTSNGQYITLKSTNMPAWTTSSSVTAVTGNSRLEFKNNSNQAYADIYTGIDSGNIQYLRLDTRKTISSTAYYNMIKLQIGPTGAPLSYVSDKAGFRNTLNLGNTTGPVPVANGGSGASKIGCLNNTMALYNLGVHAGTAAAPSSGTAGMIYIQYT